MSKHLILTVLLAGVAGAATVTAPMVHPPTASGRIIPVTVTNLDNGSSERVDRDEAYDFNGSTQGWTPHGTGLDVDWWHVEPVGYSGTYTNTWWSGDAGIGGYLSSSFMYLQTPAINLVGAVSPVLTFALYYAAEIPGGEPVGYNGWDGCNVWASTDGGATWSVISGTPAYNVSSSFAFGDEFGMGPGIPEWGGIAAGWTNATFSLSSFVGQSDVRLRFVFCADPALDTLDDPDLIGMQVDNIVVAAGGTLWADDGVNNIGGAPTHGNYIFGLDDWDHTGAEWHSPNLLRQGSFVESPWIAFAAPGILELVQDIRCDLPDADGDDNGSLEDYFYIEYTTDGLNWTQMTYDYTGASRPDWADAYVTYSDDDVFNGALRRAITSGTQIKIRYRIRTDDNHDGGTGTGLWVDNVNVYTQSLPEHDLGIAKFWIDYPRNEDLTQYPEAEIYNWGANQEVNVRASWRVYNDSTGALVKNPTPMNNAAATIDPLQSVRVAQTSTAPATWKWTPANPGAYLVQCYTTLNVDVDRSNDTLEVPVYITPANVGFLRYDYSTSSLWTLSQNDGEDGALVRFDPISSDWTAQFFFARLYNMGAGDKVHIVIHDQGVDNDTPGVLLGEYVATVTGPEEVYPNSFIRYIGNIPHLRCIDHPIWVGLRTNEDNDTGITGLSSANGGPYWEGHTYSYDYLAETASAWPGDLQMWLQVDWGVESEIPYSIELDASRSGTTYTLSWNSPGPVDGYHIYRSATGYFTPGTPVASVDKYTTTWSDTIGPNAKYFYKVVGYNGVCAAN